MPKKPTPNSDSPDATQTPIALPPYIVNIQRLLTETRERAAAIEVNNASLDELRGDLDRRILAADPTQQSALNALTTPTQHVAVLERRDILLAEDHAALVTQLGHAVAQAKDRLRVAARKHDDLLHEREVEEKSKALSPEQQRDLRERAKSWGKPSWDWALRLRFDASEAAAILRLAEHIFADLPTAPAAEV